jgi:hypothetical protein
MLAAFAPISRVPPEALVTLGAIVATGYGVLLRRGGLPPIFLGVCVLLGLLFQLGALAAVTLIALLVRPTHTGVYLRIAVLAGAASALYWTLHTWLSTSAALSIELLWSLVSFSAANGLQAPAFFIESLPLTAVTVVTSALVAVLSPFDQRGQQVTTLLALWLVSLCLISVLNLADAARYYLVSWPVVLISIGYLVDRLSSAGRAAVRRHVAVARRAAALALVLAIAVEHRNFSVANPLLMTDSSPPIGSIERIDAKRWQSQLADIPQSAVVISNDELAAVYHLGRVDYWLAANEWDLARFELVTASGTYGEYAGAQVIATPDSLRKAFYRTDGRPVVVVLFRTGRFEYEWYRTMVVEACAGDQQIDITEASGLFVVSLAKRE